MGTLVSDAKTPSSNSVLFRTIVRLLPAATLSVAVVAALLAFRQWLSGLSRWAARH